MSQITDRFTQLVRVNCIKNVWVAYLKMFPSRAGSGNIFGTSGVRLIDVPSALFRIIEDSMSDITKNECQWVCRENGSTDVNIVLLPVNIVDHKADEGVVEYYVPTTDSHWKVSLHLACCCCFCPSMLLISLIQQCFVRCSFNLWEL